jgi:hypothetical protein
LHTRLKIARDWFNDVSSTGGEGERLDRHQHEERLEAGVCVGVVKRKVTRDEGRGTKGKIKTDTETRREGDGGEERKQ